MNKLDNNIINNISDIICISKSESFNSLIKKLSNNKIKVSSNLIHKKKYITSYEQFIFNLDNYISFLKNILFINPLEIRLIVELTIYNKCNSILFSDIYYYQNVEFYITGYKKMFMFNYKKNYNILKKFIHIKKLSFDELIIKLNKIKNKAHYYFENINNNLPYYISIIDYLENTSNM